MRAGIQRPQRLAERCERLRRSLLHALDGRQLGPLTQGLAGPAIGQANAQAIGGLGRLARQEKLVPAHGLAAGIPFLRPVVERLLDPGPLLTLVVEQGHLDTVAGPPIRLRPGKTPLQRHLERGPGLRLALDAVAGQRDPFHQGDAGLDLAAVVVPAR